MAVYKARVRQEADGSWVAAAVALPHCWSRAAGRDEALAKLREEIRYRIEYCPCTGVDDEFVRVEVVADATAPRRSANFPNPAPGVAAASPAAAKPVPPASWSAARAATPAPLSGAAGCPPAPPRPAPAAGDAKPSRPAVEPPRRDWRRWDD